MDLVTRFNAEALADSGLTQFLFGAERVSTARLLPPLRELQDNACFYCGKKLRDRVEVDHFLPWSRVPDNGIENLVVADARCNAEKRAFIAAAEHLGPWAERFSSSSPLESALGSIALEHSWERHPERTLGIARAVYLRLPETADLWLRGREFVKPDPLAIASALPC